MGGLTFSGAVSEDGLSSGTHQSYDNYEQDQVLVLSSSDDGPNQRTVQLEFVDRPDWSCVDLVQAGSTAGGGVEDFLHGRPQAVRRMRLARETDGSVGLTMRDAMGRPRIVLQVPADDEPFVEMLNANGDTVARLPEQ